jgi:mannan endo-1,4-beta-mannosidase
MTKSLCSDYDSFMASAVTQAKNAGKKLIVSEWGSLYGSGRTANLNSNIQKINAHKVPWIYWQLITNADPHQGEDYEVSLSQSAIDSGKNTDMVMA